jgi:hypothetical protein
VLFEQGDSAFGQQRALHVIPSESVRIFV